MILVVNILVDIKVICTFVPKMNFVMRSKNYDLGTDMGESTIVSEPVISMDYYRTMSFLRRHNSNPPAEGYIPLHEGFASFKVRMTTSSFATS